MRQRLLNLWRLTRSSFWFLPSLMVAGAIFFAFTNLFLDQSLGPYADGPPRWLAVAGAESARSLLSTIAGSMITVAGVTFSIVVVALTLASTQFGPRLLANFMKDTGNQVVLGTFISVFAYCIVVILHLPGSSGSRLLPQTAVMTAVFLALIAVGVLIFFFHHISKSIHAGTVVREAGQALLAKVRSTLPPAEESQQDRWPPAGFSEANATIRSTRSGYLTSVALDELETVAAASGTRLMIEARLGNFILAGKTLAVATPAVEISQRHVDRIRGACSLIAERELGDDLVLAIDRVTEIAVRSMSPGINDPNTALSALNSLTVGFDALLERLPARSEAREGVYVRPPDAERMLEQGYGPIRRYGRSDVRVLGNLIDCLISLGDKHPRHVAVLRSHIERVREIARLSLHTESERERIEHLIDEAKAW